MSGDVRIMVSTVADAHSTETEHVAVDSLRVAIKHGKWKAQIEEIRMRYYEAFKKTGSHEKAKRAVDALKKNLPGILWSGTFTRRDGDSIERHSGLLCIDIDDLNSSKPNVRQKLCTSPYLYFLHDSPTDQGLKAIFSVPADPSKHAASFRALKPHVRELADVEVDEAAKDLARISFVSWDPFAPFNPKPKQIEPLPEPEKPQRLVSNNIDLSARQRIAEDLLGGIDWQSETSGFLTCPEKHLHTTGEGERDCKIDLDKVPTLHCFHNHCRGMLDGINHELRSLIGKAEREAGLPATTLIDARLNSPLTKIPLPGDIVCFQRSPLRLQKS
jgi:VirE-like protein